MNIKTDNIGLRKKYTNQLIIVILEVLAKISKNSPHDLVYELGQLSVGLVPRHVSSLTGHVHLARRLMKNRTLSTSKKITWHDT
jgi:hypothetical protein